MYCKECGTEIIERSNICANCGTELLVINIDFDDEDEDCTVASKSSRESLLEDIEKTEKRWKKIGIVAGLATLALLGGLIGHKVGHDSGYDDGYEDGYDDGYDDSYDDIFSY